MASLIKCRACGQSVSSQAPQCPGCGHPVNPKPDWSPGVAALLSLVIPGAGQMYKGQVFSGLFWLVITVAGYVAFFVPGLIFHLMSILGATMPKK